MTALASLAKFQGRYDRWLYIRQCYNLKWSSGNNSLQALQRFFNPDLDLAHMCAKIKEMMRLEHLTAWVPADDAGWQDLIDAIKDAELVETSQTR